MKATPLRFLLLALTTPLLALACTGTETGNPPFDGTMSYNAHSSDPARAALGEPSGGALVEALWLNLGDAELELCAGAAITLPGIGVADHAGADAAMDAFLGEEGRYCRARLRFELTEDGGGGPAELAGRSVLVRGRDAMDRPFEIALALERTVSVTFDAELDLGEDAPSLLFGFDVARWVGDLDLASAEADADGVVRVNAESNARLQAAFEAALAGGVELYRDLDADGVAQPDDPLVGRGE